MPIHQAIRACAILACSIALGLESADAQTPLVQWSFDEAAGGMTNAADTGTPPDTTGVLGSTATRTSDTPGGGPGWALDISTPGADTSIVNGGNSAEVDALTQFTFSSWIKVTGATDYNVGGSGNVRLLAKQTPAADGFSWNINAPQQGSARSNNAFTTGLFIGGQGGFQFSFANEDILDRGGDWLFLAVTYDGSSTVNNTNFYIGDETNAVSQLGSTVSIGAGQVLATATNFGVGFTDALAGTDFALSGYQDDVRVYDSVLDVAALEAVRLANLPAAGLEGDFNNDNHVDAADYVILRKGGVVPYTPENYSTWASNFGAMGSAAGGAATAVPEPSASMLAAIVGLVGCVTFRRRS